MIGSAIAAETHRHGFSVMPQLAGHGIGRTIHEDPVIPQFDDPESRAPLSDGAVIAIEAMITSGRGEVAESGDGWTLLTADSHLAAHVEHTVVVTPRGPLILTLA
jgi:methionyl aminopeptidase